ncbi:Uncharacterised protein [Klebsiella pneumoniae subsp. ozaenae]|uniref:Uncharacterized protein n=1 Tax=Klebsiella pneumoniae subsp. ozaenae TaxID=574 RepID=A0A377YTR8_KLEPO|nr:Uncharacterised protein [Klebsiella pneumoniae subsp. ozaenae]
MEYLLDHQRVHVDQANLQQMQRQNRQLLLFQTVCRHLSAFTIKNERICTIPVFHYVQPFIYLNAKIFGANIPA